MRALLLQSWIFYNLRRFCDLLKGVNLKFDLFNLYDRVVFKLCAYLQSFLSNLNSFYLSSKAMDFGFVISHKAVLLDIVSGKNVKHNFTTKNSVVTAGRTE